MSNKKVETQDKTVENIQTTLSNTEQFIEKNQKTLLYILGAIVILAALYWAYVRYYKSPREVDANNQMFVAQQLFDVDSFALALNGNMNYPGFIGITEDYSGTKSANIANYYAGICYFNLGDLDNAFKYTKKFHTSDKFLGSEKWGLLGDICVNQDKYQDAVNYYKKAVSREYSNVFTTPIFLKKLGLVYEKLNNKQEALKVYEKIYYGYPQSNEARTIEKYIERVK